MRCSDSNRLRYFCLGFIYIRVKVKATSLLTCCIVSNLCIYTTVTIVVTNIKEKNRFHICFRSNINKPLWFIHTAAATATENSVAIKMWTLQPAPTIFIFFHCHYLHRWILNPFMTVWWFEPSPPTIFRAPWTILIVVSGTPFL